MYLIKIILIAKPNSYIIVPNRILNMSAACLECHARDSAKDVNANGMVKHECLQTKRMEKKHSGMQTCVLCERPLMQSFFLSVLAIRKTSTQERLQSRGFAWVSMYDDLNVCVCVNGYDSNRRQKHSAVARPHVSSSTKESKKKKNICACKLTTKQTEYLHT